MKTRALTVMTMPYALKMKGEPTNPTAYACDTRPTKVSVPAPG